MRLAFVDFIYPGDSALTDYTALTPLQRPLGGMQSSLCYLAMALAARGHDVSILNSSKKLGIFGGVSCLGFRNDFSAAALSAFDVVVCISPIGRYLRNAGLKCPMVLWTMHDIDQLGAIRTLLDGSERYLWNKIVMASDWQAGRYANRFKIRTDSLHVIRNAVSPAFESLSRPAPYFFEAARPPVLIYSSTPFRGLEVLLGAFPLIRALVRGCTAQIYSSMAVYAESDDRYEALYDRCRQTDGVEYYGSVSQADLSEAYANADVFAYPSIFRETSCISLMEAMASGCMVLSTDLGALSETAAGFGHLCARSQGSSDEEFGHEYARFAAGMIRQAVEDPISCRNRLNEQRAFVAKNYLWSSRAVEWEQVLNTVAHEAPRTRSPGRNESCPCGSGERFKRCCGELLQSGQYEVGNAQQGIDLA
jgi:glycosyltransferase involved in cell wall biosynthesis